MKKLIFFPFNHGYVSSNERTPVTKFTTALAVNLETRACGRAGCRGVALAVMSSDLPIAVKGCERV